MVALASCVQRPPAAPPRATTLGLEISTVTLPNGLRVVVVLDSSATDVQVTMRYRVGSVDDQAHPGVAHLVEHLMFQQLLDGQPIFALLEDVATQFNAATTHDATTYVARGPRTALDTLLAIEIARLELRCKTITDLAFTNERDVVINELEQRDQATEIFAALYSALYPEGHPYRQIVGGTRASVGAITRADACAFMEARYAPGNAALVISGNLPGTAVKTSLAMLAAQITRRPGAKPTEVARGSVKPGYVEVRVPVDDEVFVIAWRLPHDPELQTKVRAIVSALPRLIDAEIKGSVIGLELGDTRAPMFGVAIVPGEGETVMQAGAGARRAIDSLPSLFREHASRMDQVAFDRIKAAAIYSRFATLEDGSDRDVGLATHVLAGRDPGAAVTAELGQLRGLTRQEGMDLTTTYLGALRPTSVTLLPSSNKKRGQRTSFRAPVHDMGRRRTSRDPALARKPLDAPPAQSADAITRVLPNGLRIVLLPYATVPTFDARLIFGTGTGDEPTQRRGVALLAAHTLTWDLHYLEDLLEFARTGGMRNTDVSADRTTFSVQGLDMNLDVVLAGLRRWVRDGTYDDTAQAYMSAIQRATKRFDDEGLLTDAWRSALFGEQHPYVQAGIGRHASTTLSLHDAAQFRRAHYVPDNATLVLAGRFDPVLAGRWIDFLFADWQGSAAKRTTVATTPSPASIARIDETAMLQLRVAIPARETGRAQQLVAAEMLSGIARDVRYRLGASYTVDAELAETRLARFYVLTGWIDVNRSKVAVQLVRDRIESLRNDPDNAAEAFVVARARVATRLHSQTGSAAALAAQIEQDVSTGRGSTSQLEAVRAVQALTIGDMATTLSSLDLAAATILINGPAPEVKSAFGVLGRQPTYLVSPTPQPATTSPGSVTPPLVAAEQRVPLADLKPAITTQPPPPYTLLAYPSVGILSITGTEGLGNVRPTGYGVGVGAGYRALRWAGLGGYAEVGRYSGSYQLDAIGRSVSVVPIQLHAHLQIDIDSYWAAGFVGVGAHRIGDGDAAARWRADAIYGVMVGWDWLRPGVHRIGLAARWQRTFADDISLFSLGLFYR